MKEWE